MSSTTIKQKVKYQLEFNGVGTANTALKNFKLAADGAKAGAGGLTESVFKGTFAADALRKAIQLASEAVRALTEYFKESALAAADVNEQWNKFRITMGDNALGVANDIAQIAEASNRNVYELMQGAAAMQDLIYPMGVARQQAAGMSQDFVALAVDLSSFNNVALDDALGALRSGIAGMSRPLRRLGVDVRLTAVNAELLRMGINGGTQAATEAERVTAIYNIAMRQSSDAQGDAARTAHRARNVMRGFTADWKEASVEIGQSFIPVIETLTPMLRDELSKVLPEVKELAEDMAEAFLKYGPDLIVLARDLSIFFLQFGKTAAGLTEILLDGAIGGVKLQQSLGAVGDTANWIVNPIGAASGAVLKFIQTYGEAEAALNDWNKAENAAMVTEEAATVITALYADAMEGTAEQAEFLIARLEQLESEGANVGTILDNLRVRHEDLTHEIEIGSLVIGELSGKTNDLSIEQINTARSAIKLAISQEQLNATMSVGPTATAARIAELQEYRRQLDQLAEGLGTGATGTGGGTGGTGDGVPEGFKVGQKAALGAALGAAQEEARAIIQINAEKNANILQAERDLQRSLEQLRESKIERAIAAEEQEWQLRVEIAETYAQGMSDFFVDQFRTGFENLNEDFAKLMQDWTLKMIGSGIFNFLTGGISGILGKGGGLAGQMLGKKA